MSASGAGLVIHVYGADPAAVRAAVRVARNARADLGGDVAIELVVQGAVVSALVDPASVSGLADAGVAVAACRNSMAGAGIAVDDLAPGVGTVSAAVGHLARRQWDRWAYVRV